MNFVEHVVDDLHARHRSLTAEEQELAVRLRDERKRLDLWVELTLGLADGPPPQRAAARDGLRAVLERNADTTDAALKNRRRFRDLYRSVEMLSGPAQKLFRQRCQR